jgi:hypothetical protein
MRPGHDAARHAIVAVWALAAGASWARVAGAQPFSSLPGGGAGSETLGEPTSQLPERRHLAPGSVAIFDYEHTFQGVELEGGPMTWRKAGTNGTASGWELSIGSVTESRLDSVFLGGIVRAQFRYFDSQSFAASPLQSMFTTGIRLGPFEPESRVGLSLLTVDVFHGAYSFEMFSPRVEAGFGLRIGRFRASAHIFSEMLWRWWGDNYFDQGVAFELRFEPPKSKPPFAEQAEPTEQN